MTSFEAEPQKEGHREQCYSHDAHVRSQRPRLRGSDNRTGAVDRIVQAVESIVGGESDFSGLAAKWWDPISSLECWRPVRESNPCRRREREAIHCNSMKLRGTDSTLPHFVIAEFLL